MLMQRAVSAGKTKTTDEIQMYPVEDKQVWSKIAEEQTNSCHLHLQVRIPHQKLNKNRGWNAAATAL